MNDDLEKRVASMLIGIMSDGFNRSIGALEKCGAINTNEMRKECKGNGSKYYVIVTEQLEYTARYAAPNVLETLLQEIKNGNY